MTDWEILGIESTNDIEKIKTAYMNRAKEVHPEEHPDEFQTLQHAYKQALKFAKRSKITGIPEQIREQSGKNTVENAVERTYDFSRIEIIKDGNTIASFKSLQDEFFWKFKQIYSCAYIKNNMEAWEVLFKSMRFEELFNEPEFIMDLALVIGCMEDVNKEVWNYMILCMETGHAGSGCRDAIEDTRKKMSERAVENKKVVLKKADKKLVKQVISRGCCSGLSRKQASQMMVFVPNLFVEMQQDKMLKEPKEGFPVSAIFIIVFIIRIVLRLFRIF